MVSPLMQQYYRIKAKYPDAILFFRVGDFYETFDEDAKLVSRELNIVLTRRSKDEPVPMAGIPHHALDAYLGRLVKKGYSVAICEQLEDPKKSRGLVKRDVVRIVTPGTLIEDTLLDEDNNFLMCVYVANEKYGFAALDISTGEFFAGDTDNAGLMAELLRIQPAEILSNTPLKSDFKVKELPQEYFSDAVEVLKEHFGVAQIDGFGLSTEAAIAAGTALKYAKEKTKSELRHITSLQGHFKEKHMVLDSTTLKNLEIFRNLTGDVKYTLYSSVNRTKTPMGSRLLKRWLQRPLLDIHEIKKRQDGVEELFSNHFLREEVGEALRGIKDIERIETRISLGRATPRDLLTLKESLKRAKDLRLDFKSAILREARDLISGMDDVITLIENGIAADVNVGDGVIKDGYDKELDELRDIARHATELIAQMEDRERRRTGIKNLRIKYNDVIGYYIEVSKGNVSRVPKDYIRKQTLKNYERYTTEELRKLEFRILGAKEKISELERKIYESIVSKIAEKGNTIKKVARAVACIDVIQSLAEVAVEREYVRPEIDESMEIEIKNGRHPVVELYTDFVPNDTHINEDARFIILTGPNMAGKSTYMRQVALITILAQIGSFVPAEQAKIGIVDRIYTRVGASDDIIRGRSTFMVEMVELANILNTATERSLILLDEIGRGTSTYDGLAIAWSVSEYIHMKIKARTIFATHYHHLIDLENILEGVKNYHIAVKETPDGLVFVRKVMPGGMSKSYGIEVARLAGVPKQVVDRAREVLNLIEKENAIEVRKTRKILQTVLFEPQNDNEIIEELKKVDIMNITPIEALNILNKLKNMIK